MNKPMTLLVHTLLAVSFGSMATAQTQSRADTERAADTVRRDAVLVKRDAETARGDQDSAKRDAEDAKIRAELDKARAELDRAAQKVARLSGDLSGGNQIFIRTHGPARGVLGVQVDPESGKTGARVRNVSPGGPADEAGLKPDDVIVALDGKPIAGNERSGKILVETMRDVRPDQKVKVRVLRAGKNRDLIVVARPMGGMEMRTFNFEGPEFGQTGMVGGSHGGPFPVVAAFRGFMNNEFAGLELATVTPKLGAYFGATDGVLVVSAPENGALKLEDGDVIQGIDGRKPTDGGHALRILRSYKSGETLNLTVLRQRKPVTLSVVMPERPEFHEDFMMPGGPMTAPGPGAPPLPPLPPGAGSGTDE